MSAIAIVGMACRYADARNPQELWENVLARRRAFRRMPPERLRLEDYFSADPETPDAVYAAQAALIEGYEFDRVRFRVAGPAFRSVDMAHWLALEVAADALADGGFRDGEGLPHENTGVLVGNTLTGEFSRAATMRLRWPYVSRVVGEKLREAGWDEARRTAFLQGLEHEYKSPFAPVGEETLAGALSNTIAGRICNYFHLGGGGYTLDGACCSSLLAIARACSALDSGEIDLALAGGVDLSLDPFELVGFAKTGALAHGEMRVYDRESSGFLPGEGCGFVVLMREEEAKVRGLRSYALIRGWGLSSDGAGSITRPEIRGQTLALNRAYQRAGYGPETVSLFEGHGTGTPVGDAVELQALAAVRRAGDVKGELAAIASIKANIGHTKAAAGVAGLLKAALAVHHQVIPPATGVSEPRPELRSKDAVLRIAEEAEPWPRSQPVRAGVNSFGFGGINVHVTLESAESPCHARLAPHTRLLAGSSQDAELFLFAATSQTRLEEQLGRLARLAPGLSYSELADAANASAAALGAGPWRAAIVASSPNELVERLAAALNVSSKEGSDADQHYLSSAEGIFLGVTASSAPRIGLLFPGQASPVRLDGGAHGRRFEFVRDLYRDARWPAGVNADSTHLAQVAIVTAELAGLRMLNALGIQASIALGHSLGELAAYYWAGAIDEGSLRALVDARGRSMAEIPGPAGAMAGISASPGQVEALLNEENHNSLTIACFNAPGQAVISGRKDAVEHALARARSRGWSATLLEAAHAFHSPMMLPAVAPFQGALNTFDLRSLQKRVFSTIRGAELAPDADLRRLLAEQLTAPVRFTEALAACGAEVDLWIEVGPGQILSTLSQAAGTAPAISLDVAGTRLTGLLYAAAAAHVLGLPLRREELFNQRFTRPFDFDRVPRFFVNPCEFAPIPDIGEQHLSRPPASPPKESASASASDLKSPAGEEESAVQVVRSLVARRTELPPLAIPESAHLLRDLHLNSIMVGEIVAAAARRLGMAPPRQLLEFADATVGQTAQALERMRSSNNGAGRKEEDEAALAGIDEWQRAFIPAWRTAPLRKRAVPLQPSGSWHCFAPRDPALVKAISGAALPASGVVVSLESVDGVEQQAELLLEAAHHVLAIPGQRRFFVVLGAAATCSAFARTLHLEHPEILIRIIEAPEGSQGIASQIIDLVRSEVGSGGECVEARYDGAGERKELCWRLLGDDPQTESVIPLGPQDVMLVSGGGKGIVAECCRMLAAETGSVIVILGRSNPDTDAAVTAQLAKLKKMGARAEYIVCDVTDGAAVRAAVTRVEKTFGPVTAIMHGAGRNHPKLLRNLDRRSLLETLAPKVQGLRNLLDAVVRERLRMLVTFGSVIGRAGLRGEADYALANAFQSQLTEDFAREQAQCRCLAFESSAWSGTGMADRLGALDNLRREGVIPIPPSHGVLWLRWLLSRLLPATSITLTGRLGANPPVPIDGELLPLLRFLEKPKVFYPGVELIADADVTTASDPYLMDHVFASQPLLPGVIGLEAMVQAARAVAGENRIPVLTNVRFERPLVIEPGVHVTVRLAALVRETGEVEVALRSSQTSYQVDHFRCVGDFKEQPHAADVSVLPAASFLSVDADKDLYGQLLFQKGRFHRLSGYRLLNARGCCAEVSPGKSENGAGLGANHGWFSQYLPSSLLLGDPGARDAALHAVQACVPHAVLLPVGVKRLTFGVLNSAERLLVFARRRWKKDKSYCYDVELRSTENVLREKWEELELREVAEAPKRDWPDPLVAAYLEWRVEETIENSGVAAVFDRDRGLDRRSRSERAIQKALESPLPVRWRDDGKPEVHLSAVGVSAAHSNGLTLAVAGRGPVACDLEPVTARSDQVWRDLLGHEHWSLAELIAAEASEDLQTSATRVWTALESLKKAEAPENAPLVLLGCSPEDQSCVSLGAPGVRIATSIVRFRDDPTPFAVSVLARSDEWATTNTGIASVLKRPTL